MSDYWGIWLLSGSSVSNICAKDLEYCTAIVEVENKSVTGDFHASGSVEGG